MFENSDNKTASQAFYKIAGMFSLALRLVVGWTYFSAFLRRVVLENKLIPGEPGYIGEKFNHFLPNSIGIKPVIEYLVSTPDLLWWAMVVFTLIEGIVGLGFMLGFLTRLMSAGVLLLAGGILLGSGWLGTTCLDEWQIGILGVASGFTVFLTGGGKYSLDHVLFTGSRWKKRNWLYWLASGELPLKFKSLNRITATGALLIFLLALFTNQVFHNGVWGPLHNKSVKPVIEISDARIDGTELSFTVYRTEGADVYGSFLIGITLQDPHGNTILALDGKDLARFPAENIHNRYIAKTAPGKHSLIVPLGSKAGLRISLPPGTLKEKNPAPHNHSGSKYPSASAANGYKLILTDISGLTWETVIPY